MASERTWMALTVRGGAELAVARRLEAAGETVYVPLGKRRVSRHRRRPVLVERPALPGYVLVRSTAAARLRAAIGDLAEGLDTGRAGLAIDIHGIVGRDRRVATIADAVVEDLRARERDGAFDERAAALTTVRIGDRVTVYGGPCAGLTGVVAALAGRGAAVIPVGSTRFRVALDMLTIDERGKAA